ncbi:MAG: LacI family transcriptional regulator [Lachnospiraceae bacterium]|nr:LacI family transcriptional regulator [Lachnospiraceae bacterium]
MEKKVTRKDIADIVGTTVSVVSRALNNSGYVDAEKKANILRVAEELGYARDPVTMSLEEKRTKQILFYCKDLTNAFNIALYYGMVKAAKGRGYMALLNANLKFENIKEAMIDGIILQNNYFADKYAETFGKNYHLPAVSACFGAGRNPAACIPVIEWDLNEAMEKGINYLRKRGHKKIAFAGQYSITSDTDNRGITWRNMMAEVLGDRLKDYYLDVTLPPYSTLNAPDKPGYIIEESDSVLNEETYADKGRIAARIFLDRQLDATAVICFNDEYTIGFVTELERSGMRIPEDLSIVSFDGVVGRSKLYPELVSITPDPMDMGYRLATLLLDRIEHKKIHYYAKQPCRITPGDSVRDIR